MLTTKEWDQRFLQQASWTDKLRQYIYNRIGISQLNHIIEIGCGTGVILSDFIGKKEQYIYGVDISEEFIHMAQNKNLGISLSIGDANSLPYKDNAFDVIFCHFLLLWIKDPLRVLLEMKRIAKSEGSILLLAEPDYGGRLDYPDELQKLGQAQIISLIKQGADPFVGRRLGSLLNLAGIELTEMGILGGQWAPSRNKSEGDREWDILSHDLGFLEKTEANYSNPPSDLGKIRKIHRRAIRTGERVLYIPTFYAWGVVAK